MRYGPYAGRVLGHLVAQDGGELTVAVHLDEHQVLVAGHEVAYLFTYGQRPDAHEAGEHALLRQLIARLLYGVAGGAVGHDGQLGAPHLVDHGGGHVPARRVELAPQALHVLLPVVRALGVAGELVVARAAPEPGTAGVGVAGQRAVGDAVAVHVLVTRPTFYLGQLLGVQYLAALHGRGGVVERLAHPVVHADVQVGQHQNGRLQRVGQVVRLVAELEALLDRGGEEQHVFGVAVPDGVGEADVALASAGGQARAGPHALDVPHHGGHLGVVRQAEELRHERESQTTGGGHRAGTRPARAHHHADGGELVLGLDDAVGGAAVLRAPQLAKEVAQRVDEAGGGGYGVPAGHADAAEDGTERAGLVARHEDESVRGVHGLHGVRVVLGEALRGPGVRQLHDLEVGVHQLGVGAEVVRQRLPHHAQRHAEQVRHHAHVGHVGDVLLDLALHVDVGQQLLDGHRVVGEVGAVRAEAQVGVVDAEAALRQAGHVGQHGLAVEGHHDLGRPARHVALATDTDVVPGRLALDVRREDVLAVDGDAHLEEGAQQGEVGGLAAGPVGRGNHEGE